MFIHLFLQGHLIYDSLYPLYEMMMITDEVSANNTLVLVSMENIRPSTSLFLGQALSQNKVITLENVHGFSPPLDEGVPTDSMCFGKLVVGTSEEASLQAQYSLGKIKGPPLGLYSSFAGFIRSRFQVSASRTTHHKIQVLYTVREGLRQLLNVEKLLSFLRSYYSVNITTHLFSGSLSSQVRVAAMPFDIWIGVAGTNMLNCIWALNRTYIIEIVPFGQTDLHSYLYPKMSDYIGYFSYHASHEEAKFPMHLLASLPTEKKIAILKGPENVYDPDSALFWHNIGTTLNLTRFSAFFEHVLDVRATELSIKAADGLPREGRSDGYTDSASPLNAKHHQWQ